MSFFQLHFIHTAFFHFHCNKKWKKVNLLITKKEPKNCKHSNSSSPHHFSTFTSLDINCRLNWMWKNIVSEFGKITVSCSETGKSRIYSICDTLTIKTEEFTWTNIQRNLDSYKGTKSLHPQSNELAGWRLLPLTHFM